MRPHTQSQRAELPTMVAAESRIHQDVNTLQIGFAGKTGGALSVSSFLPTSAAIPDISLETRRRLSGSIGFSPANPALYRFYNAAVSFSLLLLALPVLFVITTALLVTQGTSVFYRGPRLGIGGKLFYIYKFRTLNTSAAASVTKDRTLPKNSGLETPLGKYLRITRLDELPQLLNVLKGDMNLCGPRPVRPEIAAIELKRIPRYETRFLVKPGLVGPAQALMSHGTSKRIRALFNHAACRRPVSIGAEIMLLAAIAWSVARRSLTELLLKVAPTAVPRETLERWAAPPAYQSASIVLPEANVSCPLKAVTGNLLHVPGLRLHRGLSDDGGPLEPQTAVLLLNLHNGGRRRARVELMPTADEDFYRYLPTSSAAEYIIERYLLGLTVLGPARSQARMRT